MIKVDAPAFEKGLDFFVVAATSVDGVFARVVFVRRTGNNKSGVRDDFEGIWSRLYNA